MTEGCLLATRTSSETQVAYSLCDIVHHHRTICISVVHRSKRLVSLLTSRVPYLKLYGCCLVEGDGLGEEGRADGGFPIIIKLILFPDTYQHEVQGERDKTPLGLRGLYLDES
jgi:hypothetical protein